VRLKRRYDDRKDWIMLDLQKYTHTLELDKVLERLAEFAGCPDTRERLLKSVPYTDFRELTEEMARTGAAYSLCVRYGEPAVYNVQNCDLPLRRAQIGASLSLRDLLAVGRLLGNIRSLRAYRDRCEEKETALDELFFGLQENRYLEDLIAAAVISEDEIADDASPELLSIRRKIRSAQGSVREQLDHMIHSAHYLPYLQEAIVTLRDGRYVVPVKIEYRNAIKGLIHDTSASGQTVFIEPAGVVDANNKIKLLESEELQEIDRIIRSLSAECGTYAESIIHSFQKLVELDGIFARARYGREIEGVVPKLREDGGVILNGARHPLISKDTIVPIDIRLGTDFDTLVITGPNTGGKTVALKTLGLLTLMAMCALMIPARESSEVSVFEHVLADIGDEQSIEQSLSTFSAHMTNIVHILEVAGENSLVLMDELGAGTDPVEGAALAVALIERFRLFGARIAATTHYAEMKMYALQTPGVENACCEFDIATLRPTYRLLTGVPGRSNAFAISQRLGLPEKVIESAREHVASDSARFEDVVAQLEQTRQSLEQERARTAQLLAEAQKERDEAAAYRTTLEKLKENEINRARSEAGRIVSDVRRRGEQLMEELEELRRQKEAEDFGRKVGEAKTGYRSRLRSMEDRANPVSRQAGEGEEYILPRPLEKGDSVKIASLNTRGVVLQPADNAGYVLVQSGAIKTRVSIKELRLSEKPKAQKHPAGGRVLRTVESKATRSASTEFDMRGMNAEEGIMSLEQFLDNCVMNGQKTVTVIHGKGTGVLRAAVHNFLRRCKLVRGFRLGVYGEGESGVTVVELK
jgi:DNA mismatch repair protein MutS2